MVKKILVITYALPEEVDVERLIDCKTELHSKWMDERLGFFGRLKVRTNRRLFDREVILVETGIGKVSSHSKVTEILRGAADYVGPRAEVTVLNIGTAASVNASIGDVVGCSRFIDRDLVKIGYGPASDHTFYSVGKNVVSANDLGGKESMYSCRYSCNSGDSFVTDPEDAHQMRDGWTAVCDMEAYAQARAVANISSKFHRPVDFKCIKYITDIIGRENSIETWEEELPAARMCLTNVAENAIREFYGFLKYPIL